MLSNFILILLLFLSHEREPVKTLSDGFVLPDSAEIITTAEIQTIPLTRVGNNTPRLAVERRLVSVSGIVTRKKLEADGDYHLEIKDQTSDSTIVCEVIQGKYPEVRSVADTLSVGSLVTMKGLLFQDKYHSPSKFRTRNFIEIHPIVAIQ